MKNQSGYGYDSTYSVSEFTRLLKTLVEYNFPAVNIKGEVSSLKTGYSSGYYFDLKDESSKIRCVIFRRDIYHIGFELKDGLSVIVHGRMNLYEARGDYNIIIDRIETAGQGELNLLFERLKARLEKEGLFDESRKRKIPFIPGLIGIVTSKSGAVLHDILKIIYSRYDNARIIFVNTSVQGEKAPEEIASAVELLNSYSRNVEKIDVMIIGRGGGSLEDLWAFNEEITARAIYNSEIPVISAVGHEPDITIADYVADVRASTPSNAAEIVVPVKSDLSLKIKGLRERLTPVKIITYRKKMLSVLKTRLEVSSPGRITQDKRIKIDDMAYLLGRNLSDKIIFLRRNIEHLNKRLILKEPLHVITVKRQAVKSLLKTMDKITGDLLNRNKLTLQRKISDLHKNEISQKIKNYAQAVKFHRQSLVSAAINFIQLKCAKRIEGSAGLLESFNPYNVIKRGYAIVFSRDGKIISNISKVQIREKVKIMIKDGSLKATVEEKNGT